MDVNNIKHCKVVASITNLLLSKNQKIDFAEYVICEDRKILDDFFVKPTFKNYIGAFNYDYIHENPFIYKIGTLEDFLLLHKVKTHDGLLRITNSIIAAIISSLWFIKDNAVSLKIMFIEISNDSRIIYGNSGFMNSYYNSNGERKAVSFTNSELFEFGGIWPIVLNYLKVNIDFDELKGESLISKIPLSDFNRIQRALRFLDEARATDFLPLKITNYIALYESLFIYDDEKIQHNLCNRVAKFLGGSNKTIKGNINILKKAYNVRSRYMHGNKLTFSHAFLMNISNHVDSLTRNVLLKIMNYYWEIFELDTADHNQLQRFKKYLNCIEQGKSLEAESYKSNPKYSIQTIPISLT